MAFYVIDRVPPARDGTDIDIHATLFCGVQQSWELGPGRFWGLPYLTEVCGKDTDPVEAKGLELVQRRAPFRFWPGQAIEERGEDGPERAGAEHPEPALDPELLWRCNGSTQGQVDFIGSGHGNLLANRGVHTGAMGAGPICSAQQVGERVVPSPVCPLGFDRRVIGPMQADRPVDSLAVQRWIVKEDMQRNVIPVRWRWGLHHRGSGRFQAGRGQHEAGYGC